MAIMWKLTRWFTKDWYAYLFAPRAYTDISWFEVITCRYKNHPNGIIYYNPTGMEPNTHCKDCGDDLG